MFHKLAVTRDFVRYKTSISGSKWPIKMKYAPVFKFNLQQTAAEITSNFIEQFLCGAWTIIQTDRQNVLKLILTVSIGPINALPTVFFNIIVRTEKKQSVLLQVYVTTARDVEQSVNKDLSPQPRALLGKIYSV